MKTKTTVMVVDDHPILRQGLVMVIGGSPGAAVVGEAGDGLEAWQKIQTHPPDVAILDLGLPSLNGLDLARKIINANLPTAIVILTMHNKESIVNEALDLGVKGFILKDNAVQDILRAITAVAAGDFFLSPAISNILARRSAPRQSTAAPAGRLTKMERCILRLIAENKLSREIAAHLNMSYHTVETHRRNICEKLALRGPQGLLKYALQNQRDLSLGDENDPKNWSP